MNFTDYYIIQDTFFSQTIQIVAAHSLLTGFFLPFFLVIFDALNEKHNNLL